MPEKTQAASDKTVLEFVAHEMKPGDVWYNPQDGEVGWYYLDKDGCEIGPFASEWLVTRSRDIDQGLRPLASEALERIIVQSLALTNEIAALEEQLSNAKALRKYMLEHEVTETLEDGDRQTGVRLRDGTEYTFEDDLKVSILAADREAAYAWFAANGLGGMLKRECVISFGRESEQRAEWFAGLIKKMYPEYEISLRKGKAPEVLVYSLTEALKAAGLIPAVTVANGFELPGSTLRAWVVKCLKQGVPLPPFVQVYAPTDPVLVVKTPELPPQPKDEL